LRALSLWGARHSGSRGSQIAGWATVSGIGVRRHLVLVMALAGLLAGPAPAVATGARHSDARPVGFLAPLMPSPDVATGVVAGHVVRVGTRRLDVRIVFTMRVTHRFKFDLIVLANREPRSLVTGVNTMLYDHEYQRWTEITRSVTPGTGRHVVLQRPIRWWDLTYSARHHRDMLTCCRKLDDIALSAEDLNTPNWPYGSRHLLANMGVHPTFGYWYFVPTGDRICLPYAVKPTPPPVCPEPLHGA
jgi:hypothetical protein